MNLKSQFLQMFIALAFISFAYTITGLMACLLYNSAALELGLFVFTKTAWLKLWWSLFFIIMPTTALIAGLLQNNK